MGWRASDTRQLFFNNMKIHPEAMLGNVTDGFKTFLKTLTSGRISLAALAVGTALGAYKKALQYATEREAFGKPIYKFQSIGFKLADMATEIDASALLVYRSAWAKDCCQERVTREAAMAKFYVTEAAQQIIDRAVQLFGGKGVTKGNMVERLYREIRALRIYEGASEVQKVIIARQTYSSNSE